MPKIWTYTDLSVKESLVLEIEAAPNQWVKYEVVQFASSWGLNEFPRAQCLLAVGRRGRARPGDLYTPAAIHRAGAHRRRARARVWFHPTAEYGPDGTRWPDDRPRLIFLGKFLGFMPKKVNGRMHVSANLVHWISDLASSSALTRNGHPSNPAIFNAAAVLNAPTTTGVGIGSYVTSLVPGHIAGPDVGIDLWRSMKRVFCALSQIPSMPLGLSDACRGSGEVYVNDRAASALARIEGGEDIAVCGRAFEWGRALALDTFGVSGIEDAIAQAIGLETVVSYAGTTFWDKMVGQFFPMFGMAVVPMVESAIAIAYTPTFRTPWKTIALEDYDSFDADFTYEKPVRAVGVLASWVSQTAAGEDAIDLPDVGGCYVQDSVPEDTGEVLYVEPPTWLRILGSIGTWVGETGGLSGGAPSRTSTTPGSPMAMVDTLPADRTQLGALYDRWAQTVYVNNALKERHATFAGKLRFDVAPGSILHLKGSAERFLLNEDDLATDVYGCVARVTIGIDAEQGSASTVFQLTHVRTAEENKSEATSTDRHPLFTLESIHGDNVREGEIGRHGSPLVTDYNL